MWGREGRFNKVMHKSRYVVSLLFSIFATSALAADAACGPAIPDNRLAQERLAGGTVAFLPVEQTDDGDSVIEVVYYHPDQQCRPAVVDDYGINGGLPQLEASFIHPVQGEPNLFAIVSWPLAHAGLGMSGRYYGVYAYQRSATALAVNTFVTHHPEIGSGIVGTLEGEESTFEGTTEAGLISLMASQGKWSWQAGCNPAGSQLELNACAYVEQIEAGEELDGVREGLIELFADFPELQIEQLERFDAAQEIWQAQLQQDIDALFPLAPGDDPSYLYGSSYPMQVAYVRAFLLRQRAEFLRTYWLNQR